MHSEKNETYELSESTELDARMYSLSSVYPPHVTPETALLDARYEAAEAIEAWLGIVDVLVDTCKPNGHAADVTKQARAQVAKEYATPHRLKRVQSWPRDNTSLSSRVNSKIISTVNSFTNDTLVYKHAIAELESQLGNPFAKTTHLEDDAEHLQTADLPSSSSHVDQVQDSIPSTSSASSLPVEAQLAQVLSRIKHLEKENDEQRHLIITMQTDLDKIKEERDSLSTKVSKYKSKFRETRRLETQRSRQFHKFHKDIALADPVLSQSPHCDNIQLHLKEASQAKVSPLLSNKDNLDKLKHPSFVPKVAQPFGSSILDKENIPLSMHTIEGYR